MAASVATLEMMRMQDSSLMFQSLQQHRKLAQLPCHPDPVENMQGTIIPSRLSKGCMLVTPLGAGVLGRWPRGGHSCPGLSALHAAQRECMLLICP